MDKGTCPLWMLIADSQRGIKEIKGSRDSSDVMNMFRVSAPDAKWVTHDEVPWCAAYVGACLERAGIIGTRSLMARSYLKWGTECQIKIGAVVVFPRGKSKVKGHVGFVHSFEGPWVYVLGGNQKDAVNVQKRRINDALGFRWPEMEASYSEAFNNSLKQVLKWEGGLSDHPQDKGGLTNMGITIGRWAEWTGQHDDSLARGQLKRVFEDEVKRIYFHSYWSKVWCDQLPENLAMMHFDCAVNQGPNRARKFLQKALGVKVDGAIGPLTLAAARRSGATAVKKYAKVREKHYRSLRDFKTFGRGWINRLKDVTSEALAESTALAARPEGYSAGEKVLGTGLAVGAAVAWWHNVSISTLSSDYGIYVLIALAAMGCMYWLGTRHGN